MKLIDAFRRMLLNIDSAVESLRALVAGFDNQSDLLNRKFDQVIAGLDNQSELLNRNLNRVIEGVSGVAGKYSPENWKVELRDLRSIVDGSEFSAFEVTTIESIEMLLASPAYNDIIRPYFVEYPKMSLMAGESRAFIYGLVRIVKPELVAEIGTFYAGTAEVFARALWENGRGVLYTTDPYGTERAPAIIRQWPAPLQKLVRFSPEDSMTFLGALAQR